MSLYIMQNYINNILNTKCKAVQPSFDAVLFEQLPWQTT